MLSITEAFQKLYEYLISISGVIALVSLIVGGIIYLTSAGKPEQITKAKKQILAALLGIVLLLSSYLILRTINPELVSIHLPQLKPFVIHPLNLPPGQVRSPILFDKVKNIVDEVKKAVENIENSSKKIEELTDQCKCQNTQSLCVCSGGGSSDACQAQKCYAGPGTHPCPDSQEIKNQQQIIVAWLDEILYYRNRSLAEVEDLKDEIKKVLDEQISYYQKKIKTETDQEVKQYWEEEEKKVTEEKNLKKDLATKLEHLAKLIEEIAIPIKEIGKLPDECLTNVGDTNICKPVCRGECHDFKEGCQPDKCGGGNPCPINEIQNQLDPIKNTRSSIDQTGQEIMNIIEEIIKLKTIII